MRRRQFLSATAGVATLPGIASGSSVADSDRPSTQSFEPLGTVAVDGIKETVVDSAGDTAFAAVSDGFATVDVSDPTEPTVLAERRDLLSDRENGPLEQVYDVKLGGDQLAVVGPANPRRGAITAAVFYDVSDPEAPTQLGVYETDYPLHNCYLEDGIAYLSGNRRQRKELVLVALCGEQPRRVSSWSITDHDDRWQNVPSVLLTLHDVYVQDGRAYLAHWDAGTWVVDVSDPTDPSFVSRIRGRSPEALSSLGMQDAALEAFEPPGNDHYVAVDDAGSLLALGVESWDARAGDDSGGPGGIELWDISDPAEPTRRSSIAPPPTPDATYQGGVWTTSHNFDLVNGRLYTSWYQGGVKVFDVTDPSNPQELAAWRDSESTSFWTAQYADDSFVAPSGVSRHLDRELPDQLYVFPDPPGPSADASGSVADTAASTDERPDQPPVCARLDSTPDSNNAMAGGAEQNGSSPAGTEETENDTEDDDSSTDAGGPGFGVLAALAGLGLGVDAMRRRRD